MPRLTDSEYERLQEVEVLFSDRANWCAGHMIFRTIGGGVQHCALGAWLSVSGYTPYENRSYLRALPDALRRILDLECSVTHWNDNEGYDTVISRIREVLDAERDARTRDELAEPRELELV